MAAPRYKACLTNWKKVYFRRRSRLYFATEKEHISGWPPFVPTFCRQVITHGTSALFISPWIYSEYFTERSEVYFTRCISRSIFHIHIVGFSIRSC